ncbi:hypothetical protein IF1G_10871 [Cordyceps javanica]|uniref:Uncharacterized protein n=1 Tax=Cordyceps javanica TaxID=43265 RepID=A0A545VK12_9HYPO|nr:hypothetical protein IF1G_10871 [Cordyceps javanica]TQW01986.1 hypothetical protein IF2G_10557 [Cordyceps javanica]
MDARTDASVQDALRIELSRAGGENRVLITVAHRLQAIMDYDKVVVMGSGRILEVDSPNDLMAKKSALCDIAMHTGERYLPKTDRMIDEKTGEDANEEAT